MTSNRNSLLSHRCWTEIDLDALAFNLKRIRFLCHQRLSMIAVVKADAYGHGLPIVARALVKMGVQTLAVANIFEAETASSVAARADILLLSPLIPEEIPELVRHSKWMPTLSNEEEFMALEKEARCQKKKVRIHLKLDTGLGRLGGYPKETLSLLRKVNQSKWIVPAGLYSHLASSDTDREESLRELGRLVAFCQSVESLEIPVPPVHFFNSAGILQLPVPEFVKGVRPGLSLYGIPRPLAGWQRRFGKCPLKPVLTWKTRVALVRDVPKDTKISYYGTYQTRARTRIAVLASGYADGIFRKLSNRGEVLIHGKRCPILGRITMDMTVVNVTHVPEASWGDPAILIGKSGSEEITASEFADWAETSPYEVFCKISKRVPRIPINH